MANTAQQLAFSGSTFTNHYTAPTTNFTLIDNRLIDLLSGDAMQLYMKMVNLMQAPNWRNFSHNGLATVTKFTKARVGTLVKELQAVGLLVIEQFSNGFRNWIVKSLDGVPVIKPFTTIGQAKKPDPVIPDLGSDTQDKNRTQIKPDLKESAGGTSASAPKIPFAGFRLGTLVDWAKKAVNGHVCAQAVSNAEYVLCKAYPKKQATVEEWSRLFGKFYRDCSAKTVYKPVSDKPELLTDSKTAALVAKYGKNS